jgi:hypothetical protein
MSDTNHHPVDICPCCGADPEEDRRKDEHIEALKTGRIAEILVELRDIRELLKRMVPSPPKSIADRELPDWSRYEQHPHRAMVPPLSLPPPGMPPIPSAPPMSLRWSRKKEK